MIDCRTRFVRHLAIDNSRAICRQRQAVRRASQHYMCALRSYTNNTQARTRPTRAYSFSAFFHNDCCCLNCILLFCGFSFILFYFLRAPPSMQRLVDGSAAAHLSGWTVWSAIGIAIAIFGVSTCGALGELRCVHVKLSYLYEYFCTRHAWLAATLCTRFVCKRMCVELIRTQSLLRFKHVILLNIGCVC